ncbi:MAG: hypothetical protein D6706_02885, partial [Chloroflexi bacterium]
EKLDVLISEIGHHLFFSLFYRSDFYLENEEWVKMGNEMKALMNALKSGKETRLRWDDGAEDG